MSESVLSVFQSSAALLGSILAVSVVVTASRPLRADPTTRDATIRVFLLGVAGQCVHFVEEYLTGFPVRFPELLGLAPWPPNFFVPFNVLWISIWALSAVGLRAGHRVALAPIWFFAIAMVANGIAHPLLALRAGGYFPGLLTSPLVCLLGVLLWVRLAELTRRPRSP